MPQNFQRSVRVHKAAALSALLAGSVSFRHWAGHYPNSEALLTPQVNTQSTVWLGATAAKMSYSLNLTVRLKKGRGEKRQRARDGRRKKSKWKRRGRPCLELGQKNCVWSEWGHEIQPALTQLAVIRGNTHQRATSYIHTRKQHYNWQHTFTSWYVILYVCAISKKDHHWRMRFCIREWHFLFCTEEVGPVLTTYLQNPPQLSI